MIPEPIRTMDEEMIRDEYREELCHDRRIRHDDDWRNPDEDREEDEEDESERVIIKKGVIRQSYGS